MSLADRLRRTPSKHADDRVDEEQSARAALEQMCEFRFREALRLLEREFIATSDGRPWDHRDVQNFILDIKNVLVKVDA